MLDKYHSLKNHMKYLKLCRRNKQTNLPVLNFSVECNLKMVCFLELIERKGKVRMPAMDTRQKKKTITANDGMLQHSLR